MPDDKPKSNMEIAVDALKAEVTAEMARPRPNYSRINELIGFLRKQRNRPVMGTVPLDGLADAVREEIENQAGVGAYVTEDDDSVPNNFMPHDGIHRVRTPMMPSMPVIPADVQAFVDKFLAMSPFQADKAKKMLECAELLDKRPPTENRDKRTSITEFTNKLRERAMDILRPEFGDLPEEIKPAIRKLDLEDEIDAEFEVK